jgi:peroxiredoxin
LNRRILLAITGAGALLAVLAGLAVVLSSHRTDKPPVDRLSISGAAIHAESFPDLTGQQVSLGRWSGRFVVLNFWATWCPPCIEEMPRLNTWHANSSNGIQIVGIAADSSTNVDKFRLQHHIAFPLLADEARTIEFSKRLGNRVGLLPYSVLLSPKGEVLATFLGALDENKISQIEVIASKNK